MKVALIVPGFSADTDDWCIPVLVDAVRELAAHADVHLFALRYPPNGGRYRLHGAWVHALGGRDTRGPARVALLTAALQAVIGEHRRGSFDVIHGVWADEPGFVAVAAGRLMRVPAVVSVMGGEMVAMPEIGYGGALNRVNRLLVRSALRGASRITAASPAAIAEARRRLPPVRAERLVWGVDATLFSDTGPSVPLAGEFRILSVGSLVPVKDHATLLRTAALALPRIPGLHLHLVGDGPERAAIEALARDLHLTGFLTIHGHVRREKLAGYYRAVDVLAVTSRHEMQPAVALEAALCGLPVAGTDVGMLSELAGGGCITPVGDAERLARCLEEGPAAGPRTCEPDQEYTRRWKSVETCRRLLQLYGATLRGPERDF